MAKLLQDIWILMDTGIVLFHRVFNETVDANLFGGFLSALNSFAEEITKKGLSNFEIADKRFTILKDGNFIFIANASKQHKHRKVKEELSKIMQKFYQIYPKNLLNNWNGDVSIFSNFKDKIKDSTEEILEKFRESFW